MNYIKILIITFICTSCSLAPFTSNKSARSLGTTKMEITAGFAPTPSFTISRGFTDSFDAGVLLESQFTPQISLWGKYSFINNPEDNKFSFAGGGGVFAASDISATTGLFLGPIVSYKYDWFETYLEARYNYINWDGGEVSADDKSDSLFDNVNWDKGSLYYMQYILGVNFWFSEVFGLNLSGKYLQFFDESIDSDGVIPGIELMWKF